LFTAKRVVVAKQRVYSVLIKFDGAQCKKASHNMAPGIGGVVNTAANTSQRSTATDSAVRLKDGSIFSSGEKDENTFRQMYGERDHRHISFRHINSQRQ